MTASNKWVWPWVVIVFSQWPAMAFASGHGPDLAVLVLGVLATGVADLALSVWLLVGKRSPRSSAIGLVLFAPQIYWLSSSTMSGSILELAPVAVMVGLSLVLVVSFVRSFVLKAKPAPVPAPARAASRLP